MSSTISKWVPRVQFNTLHTKSTDGSWILMKRLNSSTLMKHENNIYDLVDPFWDAVERMMERCGLKAWIIHNLFIHAKGDLQLLHVFCIYIAV